MRRWTGLDNDRRSDLSCVAAYTEGGCAFATGRDQMTSIARARRIAAQWLSEASRTQSDSRRQTLQRRAAELLLPKLAYGPRAAR